VLLSIASFGNIALFDRLKFNAYAVSREKQYYRLFTHAFIHANYTHLFVNMFVLFSFGTAVESLFEIYFGNFGMLLYVILFVGGLIAASMPAMKKHADNPYYNAVGASGAVAAVLFCYILMRPVSMLSLMLVLPLPAFVFGILYIWYESKMQDKNDGIAHDAHIFGALLGFTLPLVFNPEFFIDFFFQILTFIRDLF
jgi:membrane associated rhomboid family serine protease